MAIKSFDVLETVIDEASKQFGIGWKINQDYYHAIKTYCEIFDNVMYQYNAIAFDVEVDDISMDIIIGMVCPDATVTPQDTIMLRLMELAKEYRISSSSSEDNSLEFKFVFSSIWEKV